MVQSGRVRKIDSVDVIQKQQTAHRRDLVAMATSASLHALLLLLLLLAVFVLPSMVGGGKRVLEVSLGDSDTFSLDATDLPVVMPPSLAEPSDVPAETPDVFVLPALEIAFIEPKKLGNESKIAPASAPTNPGAGSPSVSGTVEGAVDRITGKLVHEKLPGTVVLFLGSTVRAQCALQAELLDHLIGPRRVAIRTTALNAASEGSQLRVRLRSVHVIDPTSATGKWPGG